MATPAEIFALRNTIFLCGRINCCSFLQQLLFSSESLKGCKSNPSFPAPALPSLFFLYYLFCSSYSPICNLQLSIQVTGSGATPLISSPFGELCWAPRKWEIDSQSQHGVHGFLWHKSDLSNYPAPSSLGFLLGSAFWFCLRCNSHVCTALWPKPSPILFLPFWHTFPSHTELLNRSNLNLLWEGEKIIKCILNFLLLH